MKSSLKYFSVPLPWRKDPIMKFRITCFLVAILIAFPIWTCSSVSETTDEDDEDDSFQITLNLVSQSTGETTTTINTSNPGVVRVRVRNASGDAVSSQLVTVSTTKGTLSPDDGTAMTDSSGWATVGLLSGSDTGAGEITATASSDSETIAFQIGTITDTSTSEVGSIEFVSTDPEYIALKGTGGANLQETSIVTFRVLDSDGVTVSGQTVTFALSTEKGGLKLSVESAESDSSGLVQVVVSSGTIPTPVSVEAEVEEFSVKTISSELIVSTGLPDQDSFSISLSSKNPEAYEYDGVEVTATVHASDHFNNPIPDGTTVYFRTELGGGIDSSCSIEDGACSVTWISGGTRPSDALVTIMAYVLGEESFTDTNGNGLFDSGDSLNDDLPEAWLDIDFDGVYDVGVEEPVDFDNDGSYDSANGEYNGTLCSDTSICTKELVDVRDSIQLSMSTSSASISVSPNPIDLTATSLETVSITISDANGNSMPGGSTVDVESSNGDIEGDSSWTIPNTIYPITYETFMVPSSGDGSSGVFTVKVTSPNGLKTSYAVTVTDTD